MCHSFLSSLGMMSVFGAFVFAAHVFFFFFFSVSCCSRFRYEHLQQDQLAPCGNAGYSHLVRACDGRLHRPPAAPRPSVSGAARDEGLVFLLYSSPELEYFFGFRRWRLFLTGSDAARFLSRGPYQYLRDFITCGNGERSLKVNREERDRERERATDLSMSMRDVNCVSYYSTVRVRELSPGREQENKYSSKPVPVPAPVGPFRNLDASCPYSSLASSGAPDLFLRTPSK